MSNDQEQRLKNAEENVRRLEKRVIELEDQVVICLKFMRVQAERMAKDKDPNYPARENIEN